MAPRSYGEFRHLKWLTPLDVAFPSPASGISHHWTNAILDTGSPVHILPGRCDSLEDLEVMRATDPIPVRLRNPLGILEDPVMLPFHDVTRTPIFGAESAPRHRYEFWAIFDARGIPRLDFVRVIVMDIPAPIISVGLCVEEGMRFHFDSHGFSITT